MTIEPSQRLLRSFFIVFGLLLPSLGLAQGNISKLQKKADEFYVNYKFVEAEAAYKEIIELDPNNYQAAYRLGEANSVLQDYQEALRFYRKASEINPSRNDTVYLRIGLTYKTLGNYRRAKQSLNEFLNRHKTQDEYRTRAELEIKGCDLALAEEGEKPPFKVEPVSFNSTAHDYFPSLLDQRQQDIFVVFTSHRPKKKKKNKKYSGLGQPAYSDLFRVTQQDDSTFGDEILNLGKPINTKTNDGSSNFTSDGLTMYYTITNVVKAGYNSKIYESRYDPLRKKWSKPKPVEGVNGSREVVINSRGKTKTIPSYDRQPYITADGRTMFFVSDRDGGQGGDDIWFSRRVGTGWSQPINAGTTVNTAFDELSPYINREGTRLYFASDGHGGYGGLDIFMSEGTIGDWQDPVNMGVPINSSYDDFGSVWTDQDSAALFTSNRPGGQGGYDIYWSRAIVYPEVQLDIAVQGIIRDKITKLPIEFATAILYEKQGSEGTTDTVLVPLDTFETDQSARYNFPLEKEKNYTILGNAPDYFAREVIVSTVGLEEDTKFERNIDIELEPITISVPIVLQNIYYDFDEHFLRPDAIMDLNDLITIMQQNPNITIELGSHTDTNGGLTYNDNLSNRRALAAIRYLVESGVDPERLAFKGYGERVPLVFPERTDEDEQTNRRTEFRVMSIEFGE
ncbi:MAG: OmpA family protein [Bacteroidota bacterium]